MTDREHGQPPDRIWAQATAIGWDEPIATPFKVNHFPEYIRTTLAREAANDMLAVLETYVADEWAHMNDAELARELSLGNEMVRNVIAARAVIAKAKGVTP